MTQSSQRLLTLFLFTALLVSGCDTSTNVELPVPKNLILISIDTLRADHLGCYGHLSAKTPNIDAVAAEGVLFETHINIAPTTLASHVSLMTGNYPHTHGVPRNGFVVGEPNVMLAELLRAHGMETAAIIGAYPLASIFNFNQGFQYYNEEFDVQIQGSQVDQTQRYADKVTDAIIAYLDQRQDPGKPLFLFIHYYDVHTPYDAPAPYDTMYTKVSGEGVGNRDYIRNVRRQLKRSGGIPTAEAMILDALYLSEVSYVDAHLGRLFEDLKKRSLYDNSLLVITSDHGETMWEHSPDYFDHGVDVYETTSHSPLIVRFPGKVLAGTRLKRMVANIDVMPTLLQLFQVSGAPKMEGISLADGLARGKLPPHPPVYCEATQPYGPDIENHPVWRNTRKAKSIRTDKYKYIFTAYEKNHEFYDLTADPGEQNNLVNASRHADRIKAMQDKLLAWTDSADPLESTPEVSRKTIERLRQLGYIGNE